MREITRLQKPENVWDRQNTKVVAGAKRGGIKIKGGGWGGPFGVNRNQLNGKGGVVEWEISRKENVIWGVHVDLNERGNNVFQGVGRGGKEAEKKKGQKNHGVGILSGRKINLWGTGVPHKRGGGRNLKKGRCQEMLYQVRKQGSGEGLNDKPINPQMVKRRTDKQGGGGSGEK